MPRSIAEVGIEAAISGSETDDVVPTGRRHICSVHSDRDLDVVHDYRDNAGNLSNSEQHFEMCEIPVVSSEYDRRLIPAGPVDQWNEVVVERSIRQWSG